MSFSSPSFPFCRDIWAWRYESHYFLACEMYLLTRLQRMTSGKTLFLLGWVALLHLCGIYLYTRGFLLTRLALSEISTCSEQSCTLPPTHKRAVVLIIDALRFDFVTPNPPEPPSPYHHNVLRLPQELTALFPQHSLLFNAFADPPTTTLQRIKGITTGSLPTFVDMGSNFGGSSILEDSLVGQLVLAGRKVCVFFRLLLAHLTTSKG